MTTNSDETPVEEVVYTQPTSALDLERRLSEEADPPVFNKTVNPVDTNFDKDGYVSTDPIYHDRANETDQPQAAEEGAFKLAEEAMEGVHDKNAASEPLKESYGAVTPHTTPSEEKSDGTTENAEVTDADDKVEAETPTGQGGQTAQKSDPFS